MHELGPAFIDITWGAGGRLATLTCEMVNVAQSVYGFETCMHLTCTDMGKEKVDEALKEAYNAGCTNILALRGDPPRDKEKWEAVEGGFRYAKDLVEYIRKNYGNHFDIGVAGYPEGCDDNQDPISLMDHLKQKVDAGGTFIVTQMFYDVDLFLDWVRRVREAGITVPIVPGIMPIQTHAAFLRRANWSNCHIPPEWLHALEPVQNDDAKVREIGKSLVAQMCRKILDAGIWSLHFYTMNLAQSTKMTLEELGLISSDGPQNSRPALPWRQSKGLKRREEDVRPIFWRNRNKSYVTRTQDWDEFPNGRWGDARSPAFGQLDAYNIGLKGTNEHYIKLWGQPKSLREVTDLFVRFLEGKLTSLPWSDTGLASEVNELKADLIDLNKRGFLTINSQPSVCGVKSSDPVFGWGPSDGYCYQKAYLEFLAPPILIEEIIRRTSKKNNMTYYAVNQAGDLRTNAPSDGPNAVTWGVFPGKEIVQPTIVEKISFLAWKDEAFLLGSDWARCHSVASPTRHLLEDIMSNWYLVNIGKWILFGELQRLNILVDNDFHESHGIFKIFENLEVPNLDKTETNGDIVVNGNGSNGINGHGVSATNGVNGH
jgi:methylenetetrahydrofolate reductase (NADPH)